MIITRKYGRHLVRIGKATETGYTRTSFYPPAIYYVVLQRHDVDRVDYYLATSWDLPRIREGRSQ
jgi:hypothetical protein